MRVFTREPTEKGAELVEVARTAFERGDAVHLCTIAGPSKTAGITADEVSQILSGIAAEGWTPVNCSFIWIQQVGTVGHYLFRR